MFVTCITFKKREPNSMWIRVVVLSMLMGLSMVCIAEELSKPDNTVLLTVSGKITHTNIDGKAQFDRRMLEQLPQTKIVTHTPWTEGKHVYEGVLLNTLLEKIGASGQKLIATALNDYQTEINLTFIKNYPVLLAMKTDGVPMRVRDKGPIWIIYPLIDYSELDAIEHYEKMIWQLNRLEVQ